MFTFRSPDHLACAFIFQDKRAGTHAGSHARRHAFTSALAHTHPGTHAHTHPGAQARRDPGAQAVDIWTCIALCAKIFHKMNFLSDQHKNWKLYLTVFVTRNFFLKAGLPTFCLCVISVFLCAVCVCACARVCVRERMRTNRQRDNIVPLCYTIIFCTIGASKVSIAKSSFSKHFQVEVLSKGKSQRVPKVYLGERGTLNDIKDESYQLKPYSLVSSWTSRRHSRGSSTAQSGLKMVYCQNFCPRNWRYYY